MLQEPLIKLLESGMNVTLIRQHNRKILYKAKRKVAVQPVQLLACMAIGMSVCTTLYKLELQGRNIIK